MPTRVRNPRRMQARHDCNYKLVARPTKWGSPYRVEDHGRERTLELYERWLDERISADPEFLEPLRGYNLGCFCAPSQACHADILLRKLYARRRSGPASK